MAKSVAERAADLAFNANSIAKIIKAAMKGGLKGAAIETLKRYWPQIAAIAGVALMLTVIAYAGVVSVLFSGDTSMTITECMAEYEDYLPVRLEILQGDTVNYPGCVVLETGEIMDAEQFMALYCVINNNSTSEMNTDGVRQLTEQLVISEITEGNEETPSVYNIHLLSAEEYMEQNAFTDSQRDSVNLLYAEMCRKKENTENE